LRAFKGIFHHLEKSVRPQEEKRLGLIMESLFVVSFSREQRISDYRHQNPTSPYQKWGLDIQSMAPLG
jgi:hypothetical protein